MRKRLALLIGMILLLSGCGDIYVPKTIERSEFEEESEDKEIEAIKERVKAEYEENKNDTRYPVVIGYEDGDMKWGYINDKGGLVIGPVYDSADFFAEGFAAVSADGEAFFIDVKGDVVIDEEFTSTSSFYEGYAVYEREVEGELVMGFVSTTGMITDYPGYRSNVYDYSEGIAVVQIEEQYTFMTHDGSLITEETYDYVMPFSEGMALVSNDGDYGYINTEGELVVPMDYDFVVESTFYYQGFHNGLAAVKTGGSYGYINKQGEIVIEPSYDYGSVFSDRRASVDMGEIDYYINTSGQKPFEIEYRYGSSFKNGYAFVQDMPQEGDEELDEYRGFKLINTKGEVVLGLDIQYDHGGGYTFPTEWTKILEGDIGRIVYHDERGMHFAYIDLTTTEIIWEQ